MTDETTLSTEPMESRLRAKIEASGLSLLDLAESASVPYHSLQKWMKGINKSLRLSIAEAVWEYLTGRKFQ